MMKDRRGKGKGKGHYSLGAASEWFREKPSEKMGK